MCIEYGYQSYCIEYVYALFMNKKSDFISNLHDIKLQVLQINIT